MQRIIDTLVSMMYLYSMEKDDLLNIQAMIQKSNIMY